ncbi:uncharacterized protein MONBRDRAFT_25681 [Monosiga brevicollis MX1]|uniref:Acyltransferase n=1 Tax=Monosiga brevicollis TaxID=81824 RepID=A9V043_MONBE|nr:uncharacterized protein MONBRDRAFT_25681 [Monosiga brevicollis MX1]EDQ88945.1 predicted protein [Monosiga brevicollis MX1]|eukprot:XP_001746050.1 hypothetical protein [Monosiga brevicollis MX1]
MASSLFAGSAKQPPAPWHHLLGIAFLALLANIVEKKAAMRGCHRNPLPAWFDRFLRVAFLGILAGPSFYALDSFIGLPIFTPLLVLYLIPYSDLCEQDGGREHLYARRWWLMGWLRKRFNLKLVKTVDLEKDKAYILGIHPHSVLPFGSMVALGDETEGSQMKELFPHLKYRTLAATFCFYTPLYRDMLLFGGVVDAARYSARRILSKGYSLALVPGGATEALYCYPDRDVVYLKKRRGFVKLALQSGASLVPVFSFNENNTYDLFGLDNPTVDWAKRKFQNIFGISLPFIKNVFPKRCDITVVVGCPIACPQVEEPSKEMIQEYLDKYIEGLKQLYEENRTKYNKPANKPPLEVI